MAQVVEDSIALERRTWGSDDLLIEDAQALTAAGEPHTGAMIALVPSDADVARLVVDGGEEADQLHLTLLYLGEAALIPSELREALVDDLAAWTSELGTTVVGKVFAVNMFNPPDLTAGATEPCVVLGVSGDQLDAIHSQVDARVQDRFSRAGVPLHEQHRPWIPHITLVYTDDADLSYFTDRIGPVTFDRVRLAFGDDVYDVPLGESSSGLTAAFDPNQARGPDGRWIDIGTTLPDVIKSVAEINPNFSAETIAKTRAALATIRDISADDWSALSAADKQSLRNFVDAAWNSYVSDAAEPRALIKKYAVADKVSPPNTPNFSAVQTLKAAPKSASTASTEVDDTVPGPTLGPEPNASLLKRIDRLAKFTDEHDKAEAIAALTRQARLTPNSMKYLKGVLPGKKAGDAHGFFDGFTNRIYVGKALVGKQGSREAQTNGDKLAKLVGTPWFSRTGHDHSDLQGTIAHEFGHLLTTIIGGKYRAKLVDALDEHMGLGQPKDSLDVILPDSEWSRNLKKEGKKLVSRYGSTSFFEMIAEIWAEYSTNPRPRAKVKAVGDVIRELAEKAAQEGDDT